MIFCKKIINIINHYKFFIILAQVSIHGSIMKKYSRLVSFFCCFLLFTSNAQTHHHAQQICDTVQAQLLFQKAWELKFTNPDSAIILTRQGMNLALGNMQMQMLGNRNLGVAFSILHLLDSAEYYNAASLLCAKEYGDPEAIATAYLNLGVVMSKKGKDRKAIEYYEEVLRIAEASKDSLLTMRCLNNMGLSYNKLGDYASSLSYLMRGLNIATSKNNIELIINFSKNISNAHFELEHFEKAVEYGLLTYNTAKEHSNIRGMMLGANTLGNAYSKLKDYDKALEFFKIDLDCAQKLNMKYSEAIAYHNIGNTHAYLIEYPIAIDYFNKALKIKLEIKDSISIAHTYCSLATAYLEKGDLAKAKIAVDSSTFFMGKLIKSSLKLDILLAQRDIAEKSGKYREALAYTDSLMEIKDITRHDKLIKRIAELETLYKTEQQNRKIDTQEAHITNQALQLHQAKLQFWLLIAVSTLIFAILIASYLIFRRRKQAQLRLAQINEQVAEERYQKLYTNSQLQIIQEKIAGQEEERTRIARELHDGVGGNLVALKMQLERSEAMANSEDMTNLHTMVSSTLDEVRSISHNLMPPVFDEVGIDQVLSLHVSDLNQSGEINFSLQLLPRTGWHLVPKKVQIEIYRILQELCSNIIKYSDANQVSIILSNLEGNINLIIEDNGLPFTYSQGGIGYRNIKERLTLLNGTLQKDADSVRGNTHHIEIPLLPD